MWYFRPEIPVEGMDLRVPVPWVEAIGEGPCVFCGSEGFHVHLLGDGRIDGVPVFP